MKKYELHKQEGRYYVVPSPCPVAVLPYPDNFLSFCCKKEAERVCDKMDEAWQKGNMEARMNALMQNQF